MKSIYFILFIVINLAGFSQSIKNPEDYFTIDTPFVFNHFNDFLITKEYTSARKGFQFDTIYSADYDNSGNIIAEFINESTIQIKRHEFDSLNREVSSKTFKKSQFQGKNGLHEITFRLFFYNCFDSLLLAEYYDCRLERKPEIIKEDEEKMQQMKTFDDLWNMRQHYSDYTSNWIWTNFGRLESVYDSNRNRILVKHYMKNQYDTKWIFKYDSLNNKIFEYWCNHAYNEDYSRDSNICQMGNLKYFFHFQDSIVAIDTNYFGVSMTINRNVKYLNSKHKVVKEVKSYVQYDRTRGFLLEDEGQEVIEYFFDEKERIIKRTERFNEYPETIFRYIYNKNGG